MELPSWLVVGIATRRARSARNPPSSKYRSARPIAPVRVPAIICSLVWGHYSKGIREWSFSSFPVTAESRAKGDVSVWLERGHPCPLTFFKDAEVDERARMPALQSYARPLRTATRSVSRQRISHIMVAPTSAVLPV